MGEGGTVNLSSVPRSLLPPWRGLAELNRIIAKFKTVQISLDMDCFHFLSALFALLKSGGERVVEPG
jgi:hypothetical protein